ncbi:LacI family DNA-binding transcriptional regulator [Lentzea sp. JNUCC 0626]|uniref:LacI family DNA-binding transcriptional regulator n=1 Tax=Lentzea sp. JNUCC 0626 TaxID=3367513 RepID=UPI00374A7C02
MSVARLACVSQKTVSRVCHNEPYASTDVRTRVLQAADRLNYRPNTAARALVSGHEVDRGGHPGTTLHELASLLLGLEQAAHHPRSATFTSRRTVTAGIRSDLFARAATEHLLDLGHRTVHHVADPARWFSARDRLAAWHTTLIERSRPELAVPQADWPVHPATRSARCRPRTARSRPSN